MNDQKRFPLNNNQSAQSIRAPLLKRLMAFLYDLFILFALSMGYWALATIFMVFILGQQDSRSFSTGQNIVFLGGWFLTLIGFYWFFWKRAGQTVGMRAWRLKLISTDQTPLSHSQILIRVIIAPISIGLLGLGYWWSFLNKNQASWHDLASHTQVVMTIKPEKNP